MCGIVGYIGHQNSSPILLEGLARLEYRGYDSSGIALVDNTGSILVWKKKGKLDQLRCIVPTGVGSTIGVGHTRWATHGEPNDANAHPHCDTSCRITVVHNGIIENSDMLRASLQQSGVEFSSDTDSECLAHMIAQRCATGSDLENAVRDTLANVEGTYGLVVMDAKCPDMLVVARNGSPVILGVGANEMLVASDVSALVRHTSRVVHLDDREMAVLYAGSYRTSKLTGQTTTKNVIDVDWGVEAIDKGTHDHFMRKEIAEQPAAIRRALSGRIDDANATVKLGGVTLTARDLRHIRRVKILGCGSAYYAGIAGAQLIESIARIPADAEPASEFRYRNPVIEDDVLYIAVSQSGETADTLAAIHEVKRKGGRVLAVVNAVGSTIAREADGVYLHAGPEVSVASTKVFTSMCVAFGLLAIHFGRIGDLSEHDGRRLLAGLRALPDAIQSVLDQEADIEVLAAKYAAHRSMYFIGRNAGYPIALEGAQKLKEVSYIHAEAYPASELKHGPLALVTSEFPVIAVVPDDGLYDKNIGSVQQVRARKGPVIGIVQPKGLRAHTAATEKVFSDVICVPETEVEFAPVVATIPLQLLAYHAAMVLRRDVDQPRNLAKSVTVE